MTPRLPFAQPHPLRAGAELLALRATGPIHKVLTPVGDEAWLVTGYAEVRALMDDERLGRSHRSPQTAPRSRASALFGGPIGEFESEPQGHRRMRDLLQPLFSPRRLRALQVRVEALTAGLLDQLADTAQPADLHAVVAHPLPVLVICELLGVPYGDRDRFRVWVDAAAFADDIAESGAGMAALVDYGVGLVAEKRKKETAELAKEEEKMRKEEEKRKREEEQRKRREEEERKRKEEEERIAAEAAKKAKEAEE